MVADKIVPSAFHIYSRTYRRPTVGPEQCGGSPSPAPAAGKPLGHSTPQEQLQRSAGGEHGGAAAHLVRFSLAFPPPRLRLHPHPTWLLPLLFYPTFHPLLRGGFHTQLHRFVNNDNKKIIHHLLPADPSSVRVLALPIHITAFYSEDKLAFHLHGGLDVWPQTGLKDLLHKILFKAYRLFYHWSKFIFYICR